MSITNVRLRLLPLLLGVGLVGCHDLTGNQGLPAGTQDPNYYNNATSAIAMRNVAVVNFNNALPPYIVQSGLLGDELIDPSTLTATTAAGLINGSAIYDPVDERILPELAYGATGGYGTDTVYNRLQGVRTVILQAIGQLATYGMSARDTIVLNPAAGRALRGELYALYGMTEIMLADLFCSGVPLSTLDFHKDYTYRAGSSTQQVYFDAIGKLDTALALAGDSTRIEYLARVGLGRAYLNAGNAAAAADDVSSVPTDFSYHQSVQINTGNGQNNFSKNWLLQSAILADREGKHGLPYLSDGDPRTANDTSVTYQYVIPGIAVAQNFTVRYPLLYAAVLTTQSTPITIASGIEARLIEAEAALKRGNFAIWLTKLNQLRTGGIAYVPADTIVDTLGVTNCDEATVNCGYDPGNGLGGSTPNFGQPAGWPSSDYLLSSSTVTYPAPTSPVNVQQHCYNASWYVPCWQGDSMVVNLYISPAHTQMVAGTGGVPGLTSLTDPGTDSARIALMFQERAAWLYLTGHRQGDLRRQLRQYPQYWSDQSARYPDGPYPGLGAGVYGADVTAPIPAKEYLNPLFQGCLNRAP